MMFCGVAETPDAIMLWYLRIGGPQITTLQTDIMMCYYSEQLSNKLAYKQSIKQAGKQVNMSSSLLKSDGKVNKRVPRGNIGPGQIWLKQKNGWKIEMA